MVSTRYNILCTGLLVTSAHRRTHTHTHTRTHTHTHTHSLTHSLIHIHSLLTHVYQVIDTVPLISRIDVEPRSAQPLRVSAGDRALSIDPSDEELAAWLIAEFDEHEGVASDEGGAEETEIPEVKLMLCFVFYD
jgi:hypothetical protein